MARLLSFPDPVNEKAARLVAAGAVALAVAALVTGSDVLLVVLALGFLARVLTGPTLSPLGRAATWAAGRYLGEPKPVPGPPKRFAQGIGAALTTVAAVAALAGASATIPTVLLAMLIAAAGLEAVFALCLGCRLFALLMRAGVVPEAVCERCAAGPVARVG